MKNCQIGQLAGKSDQQKLHVFLDNSKIRVYLCKNRVNNVPINFENPTFWPFERGNLRLEKVSTFLFLLG